MNLDNRLGRWGAWVLVILMLGCGGEEADEPALVEEPVLEEQPPEEWRMLAERNSDQADASPRSFTHSKDSLRVISELREASSPVSNGVIVTNVVNGEMIPIASVYVQQRRPTEPHVDTTMVAVADVPLQLHIAEHRGLDRWRVTVEERVTP